MADAGGAELCGNPMALASALRKLSADPGLDHVKQQDVAQLFIVRPDEMSAGLMSFMNTLFASHPDTEKRIAILEQFWQKTFSIYSFQAIIASHTTLPSRQIAILQIIEHYFQKREEKVWQLQKKFLPLHSQLRK